MKESLLSVLKIVALYPLFITVPVTGPFVISAIRISVIRISAIWISAIRISAVRISAVRISAVRISAVRISAIRISAIRISAVWISIWISVVGVAVVWISIIVSAGADYGFKRIPKIMANVKIRCTLRVFLIVYCKKGCLRKIWLFISVADPDDF
jgi:hypothetical protein